MSNIILIRLFNHQGKQNIKECFNILKLIKSYEVHIILLGWNNHILYLIFILCVTHPSNLSKKMCPQWFLLLSCSLGYILAVFTFLFYATLVVAYIRESMEGHNWNSLSWTQSNVSVAQDDFFMELKSTRLYIC